MEGCTCEHIMAHDANRRDAARAAVRMHPRQHIHSFYDWSLSISIFIAFRDKKLGHPLVETYPSAGECHRIYRCGPMYISVLYGGRVATYRTCPIGLPMYADNRMLDVLVGHYPCENLTNLVSLLISPSTVSRHGARICTTSAECTRHIRDCTGAWMLRNIGNGEFITLCGIVPPIRHEFGYHARTMMARRAVVYMSRRRPRVQRNRGIDTHVIRWDIPRRLVHMLRIRREFAVDSDGCINVEGIKTHQWPLI